MITEVPLDRTGIAVRETHSGVVFLIGDRAYKLKKPVDLGFLDFRTRQSRQAACGREVALNRRLAPDVYLGVANVSDVDGEPCDHLVVMRRMPEAAALVAKTDAGLALRHLRRGQVRLILVGGMPGTGKTTLAGLLADELGAVLLSSDRLRKELAGLDPGRSAAAARRIGLRRRPADRRPAGRRRGRLARGRRGAHRRAGRPRVGARPPGGRLTRPQSPSRCPLTTRARAARAR